MKRILIFSDSLALPRPIPEVTNVEDTYPYLLRDDYDVFQFSKGGGLISDIYNQVFYHKQYFPDIVILHCGIVDCAPRTFTQAEEKFLRGNRFGQLLYKVIAKTIGIERLRNIRDVRWTNEGDFEKCCKFIRDSFTDSKVYCISILPASSDYEKKVPGVSENITKYNAILKDVFLERYIDISGISKSGIMSDGHHLTSEGHKYVYDEVMHMLKNDN